MRSYFILLAAAFVTLSQAQTATTTTSTTTTATCQTITEAQVRSLFSQWNSALATYNSTTVAQRYSSKAVLLPTVSDIPRNTSALIINYFDSFLLKKPQGVILSGDIFIGCNYAQDAGIYEFTMGKDGSKVKARYTYVYVWENGQWRISQHHSSVMPEGFLQSATSSAGALKAGLLMLVSFLFIGLF